MNRKPHHGPPPRTRTRRRLPTGAWEVRARVERFIEPALLLLLRESPAHGYELADGLAGYESDDRIDHGNLYRLLRGMEFEGVLSSWWDEDAPGRSKRTYELTDEGRRLLETWAGALGVLNRQITRFLDAYEDQ